MNMEKDDLKLLKGVGPSVETKLNNLDIFKQTDLLFHLPSRYEDRTTIRKIGTLESNNIMTALHQIFTQVRFKHVLEIRGPDRPPFGHELAPAAFFQGILRSPDTLEKVMEICTKWSSGDRNQLNKLAQTIDLSCEVAGQTLQAWCEQFLSFALEGLTESREKKFLEPFAEKFLTTGPFSLSIQASFEKSGKSVEQFLKDRWEKQKDFLIEKTKQ